ncbi:PBP1A family penicillin-binding protein [Ectobacillus polymachus]|uniref:PBP1A family penicillin-binding protein n=1 Tax=Ectobacillus polymachus TaxID=1508806 RepID=UPI003A87A6C9
MSDNYRSREERRQAEKVKQGQQGQQVNDAKPRKKGSFLKKFLVACLLIGIVTLGAGVATFFAMIKDAPKIDESKLADPVSTKFYDKDGNLIHEYGSQKRTPITYDQVPKVVEEAFLATEDSRFYEHHGVDIIRTTKAILANVSGGFGSQGGSTITQQVIKNSFLSSDKTLKRKVQEWYLAYKLEQKYSKHEILTMYLNKINLGNKSWGLAAAAKNYYGIDAKDLNKLTLPQAAMLAGLPQSPNNYDPTKPENKDAATKRRNLVLTMMNKQGYITQQEMEDAMKVPVDQGLQPPAKDSEMPYQAFLDAATKEVEAKLPDVNIGTDGLSIYTTLDPKAQQYADEIVNTQDVVNYPNDKFQAAFVFMDSKTSEVRAVGSGRNDNKAQFKGSNFAIDISRQPGSSFKPIFDYGPAIENLKWSTGHQIEDKETKYNTGDPISNWDNQYHGVMSIRNAIAQSYNIPALLTMRAVGKDKSQAFAQGLGITFDNNQTFESTAIGANNVNPLEMAGAYGAFANSGNYTQPHFVQKVVYPDGKEVSFKPKPKRVMKDYTAYMITDMLRSVISDGTGKTAAVPGLDVAGKTGTTNFPADVINKYDYPTSATNDSWFCGYTPQYTMTVWTGYVKNGPGMYMDGNTTKISQKIFKEMFAKFGTDTSTFQMPDDVERDPVTNELNVKGGEKIEAPAAKPDVPSGLQAKYDQASNTISLSWAFNSATVKNPSFDVSYTLNGGAKTALTSTKSMNVTLSNVKPGGQYSFSIVANSNGQSSDAVTVTVVVPGSGSGSQSPPTPPNQGNQNNGQSGTPPAPANPTNPATPPNSDSSNGSNTGGSGSNTGGSAPGDGGNNPGNGSNNGNTTKPSH